VQRVIVLVVGGALNQLLLTIMIMLMFGWKFTTASCLVEGLKLQLYL